MRGRGQANLPALAIALLVVTTVAGLSLADADSALVTADRDGRDDQQRDRQRLFLI
jgi:hypothetical protein